ncbi:uncharacterized protein LOC119586375 [Penaeus monodon]|uniref:uncharacterized protein LOC119586375 n=1 Tax=Penaeus monodon TaxID=6687 RepID=UPI0018A6EE84|nr:uncharacterized protein LOC119586375 [Penaeus monodon]
MRLRVALMLMFFGTASCLQFLDECVPRKYLKAHIKGGDLKLRVWVPEIGDTSLLTLISENARKGISRKIEIRKNVTTVQTKDEESASPEEELPIQNNSLPHGWVNFLVTSKEKFTVTVPDVSLTLIDIQDVVLDKNIKITGSNVTVNCRLPTNQWEVSASQEAVIPLSLDGPHDFKLFSRTPFTPVLAVGFGSLGPVSFPSLSSVFKSESQQLTAFFVYNFTLDCGVDEKWICYIQAGDSTVLAESLPGEATSLSLKASGTNDYIIVQGLRKDQEGSRPGEDQGEDQNGGRPVITVRSAMIATAVSLVAIVFIFIFIRRKMKCR